MNVKWIGSPYFGYPDGVHGRNGYKPIAVVMHIAEGSLAGCDAWFNSPNNEGSSTNYCIGKNGEIHQYVLETDAAWGNGQVKSPTWSLLIPDVNPNLYTISIEHEGFTGEPWTEAMFASDVALITQIAAKWGIAYDAEHIIGHYRIDSVTRPRCPGTGLPWDRLFAALGAVPVPPPDTLQQQIKKLKDQVATLNGQVTSLKGQITALQGQSAAIQEKLSGIGRLVRTADSPQVFLLKNGTLYPIADQHALDTLYSAALVETINNSDIAGLPHGAVIQI